MKTRLSLIADLDTGERVYSSLCIPPDGELTEKTLLDATTTLLADVNEQLHPIRYVPAHGKG